MVTIAAPFASGTITSVSGTSTIVSGGASAGWVGRCIRMTSGPAIGQIRRITAFISATSITIEYAWNVAPSTLSAEGLIDVLPVAGNTFAISHSLDDIDDGTTLIKDPNAPSEYRFTNVAQSFTNNAFLYDVNKVVRFPSDKITIDATACWMFGDIDVTGRVSRGCTIVDYMPTIGSTITGFVGVPAATLGNTGDFHLYGASIIGENVSNTFWRFYRGQSHVVRFIGCRFNCPTIGMRLQGSKSCVLECKWYGNISTIGPFGPIGAFGLVKDVDVASGLNVVYHSWDFAQSGQFIQGISINNLTRIAQFASSGTVSAQYIWEAADVSINQIAALTEFYLSAGTIPLGPLPLLRISNYLDATFVDQASLPITESKRMVVRDVFSTTSFNLTDVTGTFPRQKVLYRQMNYQIGTFTWAGAGGTTYAPYSVACAAYNYNTYSSPLSFLTSEEINAAMLTDTSISQTVKATVDAYTSIDNLDQLYDRAKSWFVDNLALANPSFGVQPITASGTSLNLGSFTLVVNSAAASAFAISGSTITIRTSNLQVGSRFSSFVTSASVSLLGGAIISSLYTSSTGASARLELSGLTSSNVYVQDGAGTQISFQSGVTGTYTLLIAPGATGTWRWVAKRAGYEHATGTFSPGVGGLTANTPTLPQKLLPDGSPMYQGTTSALCAVSFSGITNAFIDIGNGTAPLQATFDECEDALITAAGLRWLASGKDDVSQFNSAAGDFFFITTAWRLRRALPSDSNATILAFVQSTDGTPVDEVNGPVRFFSSDSSSTIAAAVVALMNTSPPLTNVNNISAVSAQVTTDVIAQMNATPPSVSVNNISAISTDVIAQMNASPPNVNVELMNGAEVIGDGTEGNAWRGLGVPP